MDFSGMDSLVKALLHTLWQGGAVFLLLSAALAAIPVRRAALRYGVSLSALLLILLLGVGTWAWNDVSRKQPRPLEAASILHSAEPLHKPTVVTTESPNSLISLPKTQQAHPHRGFQLPPTAFYWIGMAWGVGVIVSLIRCVVAVIGAGNLRRRSREISDPTLLALASELCRKLNVARPIRLLVSEQIQLPAMIGLLGPAVLLPSSLLTGLPPEYLRAVLAHEIAHIARWDYLVNLGQMILEALLFFNPFVWWISRQVRLEREACCDLAATGECDNARHYIKAILACAEAPLTTLPSPVQTLGSRSERSFYERVRRLLVPGHSGSIRIPWVTLVGILAAAGLLLFAIGKGALWTAKILTPKERIEQTERIQREVAPLSDPERKITLSGAVSAEDGTPLPANVRLVMLIERAKSSTFTGISVSDGVFSTQIKVGMLSFAAIADGYAPTYISNFRGDKDCRDLQIKLKKGFPAKIYVTDAEGHPLKNVAIKGRYEKTPSVGQFETVTDEKGEAHFAAVGSEPMVLEATKAGFQSGRKTDFRFEPEKPLQWVMKAAPLIKTRVVSSETGVPVPNAQVSILNTSIGGQNGMLEDPVSAPAIATTDAQGEFVLNELRTDALYTLQIKADGFQPFVQWSLTTQSIPREIRLAPPLHIKGRVIQASPYSEMLEIRCEQSVLLAPNYAYRIQVIKKVPINNGVASFEFNGLYAANTTIGTDAGRGIISLYDFSKSVNDVTLDLTHPGNNTSHADRAKRWIKIRVDLPEKAPAAAGHILVTRSIYDHYYDRTSTTSSEPIKNNEAWVEIDVPNDITIEPHGLIGYTFAKREEEIPEGITPVEIRVPVSLAGAFLGEIFEADGSPARGCFVTVVQTSPRIGDGAESLSLNPSSSSINTTGSFVATPLPFGREYAFIARRDETFAMSSRVRVEENIAMPEARVELPKGVTVSGRLVDEDGEPIPLVRYGFFFETPFKQGFSSDGFVDADGRFTRRHLNFDIPGSYEIEFRPEKNYVPTTVVLNRKQLNPTVVLKRGRLLTGTVVDAETGLPFEGVQMYAYPEQPSASEKVTKSGWVQFEAESKTDAQGSFRFSNLPPGKFRLNAGNANLADTRTPVIVESGQTEPVVLMMKRIPTR